MKRLTIAVLALCLPLLGGCGMLRSGYPRLEQLRVVRVHRLQKEDLRRLVGVQLHQAPVEFKGLA